MSSALKEFVDQNSAKYKQIFGNQAKEIYPWVSTLGFTLAPELLFNGKIDNLSSVVGSGVYAFTFLSAGQVFGLSGLIAHSIIYGIGGVSSAFIILAK